MDETGTAELDGWRIAWESRGEGSPAVVFVHGASSSRRIWHRQMEDLDAVGRLLAVDMLGFGDSDKPETAYTLELLARSVGASMDAAGIDEGVLVAHSLGVPVVRTLYRIAPRRFAGIVAVDGAFRQVLGEPVAAWMRTQLERPDFEEVNRDLVEQMPVAGLGAEDVELLRSDALATPRHVMTGCLDAQLDPGAWDEISIEVPLLAIHTAQPWATPEYDAHLEEIAPDVECHRWDDASHFLMLERPGRFNALLRGFLAKV